MSNFKRLLSDIQELLKKEKITSCDNIISLYDFYIIINNELNELRRKYIDFDLNKELKKTSIINLTSKINPLIVVPYMSSWKYDLKNFFTLTFEYDYRSYIEFVRDINKGDVSYNYRLVQIREKVAQNFIKHHYNNALKILSLIEEYSQIVGKVSYIDCYREKFNSDALTVTLKIDNSCLLSNSNMLKYKIRVNPNHEDFYYFDMQKNDEILRMINKNSYEVMNRIPVDVTKLSEPFNTIYQMHIEKEKNKLLKKSID